MLLGARRLSRARGGPAVVQQGSILGKAHRIELQVPTGLVCLWPDLPETWSVLWGLVGQLAPLGEER